MIMKKLIATISLLSAGLSLNAQNWQKLNYEFDYSFGAAPKIFVSPDDGIIIAGVKASAKEIAVSKDGGTTWQQVFPNMAVINASFSPDGTAWLMTAKKYLTTSIYNMDTLYSSADGLSWTNMGYKLKGGEAEYDFHITGNNTLLFPNASDALGPIISKSIDNGMSWTNTAANEGPLSASYTADTIVVSTTSPWPGGIKYSHDGGASFTNATGVTGGSIPVVLPNGEIWAANIGKLNKSTDGGATFTSVSPNPFIALQIQEFYHGANGSFYIRDLQSVLETSDGVTYTNITGNLPDADKLMDIAVSNNYIYAITDTSIYRTPLGTGTSVARNPVNPSLMNIFPNPATDRVYVEIQGESVKQVELADQLGRVVRTTATETFLDLQGISSGVYFVKVRTRNEELIRKVIVQ
jgi:hypothetical protein